MPKASISGSRTPRRTKVTTNWADAKSKLETLSDEEQRIVDMLAADKTQAEIAAALGQHRSMVWRKVRKLRSRLGAH